MKEFSRAKIAVLCALIGLVMLIGGCARSSDAAGTQTPVSTPSEPPATLPDVSQAAPPLATGETPAATQDPAGNSVNVIDQTLGVGNTLTVDRVTAAADSWIVIHADDNGKPGAVVGYVQVKAGQNDKVEVPVTDPDAITARLWAMIHEDAGVKGKYEFPGPDIPVMNGSGGPVMEAFTVS